MLDRLRYADDRYFFRLERFDKCRQRFDSRGELEGRLTQHTRIAQDMQELADRASTRGIKLLMYKRELDLSKSARSGVTDFIDSRRSWMQYFLEDNLTWEKPVSGYARGS